VLPAPFAADLPRPTSIERALARTNSCLALGIGCALVCFACPRGREHGTLPREQRSRLSGVI
jgi:hypothetical protein